MYGGGRGLARGADAFEPEPQHSVAGVRVPLLAVFGFVGHRPCGAGAGGLVLAGVWGRCRRLVGVSGPRACVGDASEPCRCAPEAAASTGSRH